ncbi:MAG TPA: hypothetical protein VFN23_14750 [Ktedonobacteraceae bacterium]|nr:hypothetical protein [Ktedonobacteraceae bacterium]
MTNHDDGSMVSQMEVRRERWPGGYNQRGIALVHPGQKVQPDQPVIRLERADKADQGLVSLSSPSSSTQKQGLSSASISGDRPSLHGFPAEEILRAGLNGRVMDVTRRGGVIIESQVSLVRGVVGAGRQVSGSLCIWQPGSSERNRSDLPPGALLVLFEPVTLTLLHKALAMGATGLIASSISLHDFEAFLRIDALRLLSSLDVQLYHTSLPPLTLFFTEGFGTCLMPDELMIFLRDCAGSFALLEGMTSVRESLFPELLVPSDGRKQQKEGIQGPQARAVKQGVRVRVLAGDCRGTIGVVNMIFPHRVLFPSGIRVRAARLRLENGTYFIVPLNSIERIS